MAGICFHYSVDLMQREYWSYIFEQFAITEIYEVGRPAGIESNYLPTVISAINELPTGRDMVVLQHQNAKYIQGTLNLETFVHPADPLYVFGSDSDNLFPAQFTGYTYSAVYIPPSLIEMFSFQAGAICMYDRMVKGG